MSLHKSLKIKDELLRKRSVLSRTERLAAMKERGTWKEGDPILGLPKLRTAAKIKKRKKKEAPAAAGDAAPADAAASDKAKKG